MLAYAKRRRIHSSNGSQSTTLLRLRLSSLTPNDYSNVNDQTFGDKSSTGERLRSPVPGLAKPPSDTLNDGEAYRSWCQAEAFGSLLYGAMVGTKLVFWNVDTESDATVVVNDLVEEIRDAEVDERARRNLLREG